MPKTSPLDGSEWAHLREQVATIQALVKRRYGAGALDQSLADLAVIQRLIDDQVFDETQPDEVRSIGVVFGNVLQKELGFEWTALDDERGREPGLVLKTAKPLMIHPMRMVLGRVAAGTRFDFQQMFRDVKADVARVRLI